MKVLNFGSLNVDYVYKVDHVVAKGETLSSSERNIFAGGKGLNQSAAFAKAGAEVWHAGNIGRADTFLTDLLVSAGVNVSCVNMLTEIPTGHAIIQNSSDGDNCILLFGGANQAVSREQVDEVMEHFEEGDYLVLQNEINNIAYIMEKAHEKGMKIVLNPSPMNEKIFDLPLSYVNWFLLNEVEAAQIAGGAGAVDAAEMAGAEGGAADAAETAGTQAGEEAGISTAEADQLMAGLARRFPDADVVLTLGADGSICRCAGVTTVQKAFKVQPVDTTAAGDTFTGYFIAGVIAGDPIPVCLERASMASAISVTRNGAAPSIPTADEVREALSGR